MLFTYWLANWECCGDMPPVPEEYCCYKNLLCAYQHQSSSDYLDHCWPLYHRLGILTVYSHSILNSILLAKSDTKKLFTMT